jgi:hypothetical protein
MTASYYFWKWADNDLPGPPDEVLADLLRGRMHPAIQPFDPSKLVKLLEKGAERALKKGEEWDWQVVPAQQAGLTNAIFATADLREDIQPHKIQMAQVLWSYLLKNRFTIHAEGDAPMAGPFLKHNHITSGQGMNQYDIKPEEVRALLLTLRRSLKNPYVVLVNRKEEFVQCYLDKKRRYLLEWRQFYRPVRNDSKLSNYDQWRLVDQARKAALPLKLRRSKAKLTHDQDPDLVSFPLVVEAFEAFIRGEPPPRLKNWRSVKEEI